MLVRRLLSNLFRFGTQQCNPMIRRDAWQSDASNRQVLIPRLRRLEPRYVLNASAELTQLGQLLITGTAEADFLSLESGSDATILLRDELGRIIPIDSHPGTATDPLAISDITAGSIAIGLGSGDDHFVAELPSGLNVTLFDQAGSDTASVRLSNNGPNSSSTYDIGAEAIEWLSSNSDIEINDDVLILRGSVFVGSPNITTDIFLDSGQVNVLGRLTLDGDLNVFGVNGSNVDFSGATTTSSQPGTDLLIELDSLSSNPVRFGAADDSGDFLLSTVTIDAREVTLGFGDIQTTDSFRILGSEIDPNGVRIETQGGDVQIVSTEGDLMIAEIDSSGGDVSIQSAGTIALGDLGVIRSGVGTISLEAQTDIVLGSIESENTSDTAISLVATDGAIIDGGDRFTNIIAAQGGAQLSALSGIGDIDAIETQVDRVLASVSGEGAIRLAEADSIELVSIETENGEIELTAAESIRIEDLRPQSDNEAFFTDALVIAGGDRGRISLSAINELFIGNGVAIAASQANLGAIHLSASQVTLGEQIEIRTGESIGIARYFLPRPMDALNVDSPTVGSSSSDQAVDHSETPAFFDPDTVSTIRLVQANENDGRGVLSILIGREGEQGLTLNVDWGSETDRYEQFDGLVGNEVFAPEHTYTEQDILETRLNGRPSATEPLEVRFSVRHHESIVVLGDSVSQGINEGERDIVELSTGVVSATDNDNPLLGPDPEAASFTNTVFDNPSLLHVNGEAQFIIPSLSIPVAFFPVRNVIPEPEQPQVVVTSETFVPLGDASVEQAESSVSSAPSREEYFQIRVLSPDPTAEDLVPAERLPEDILEGDRLKQLFESLPDGRYAIEYVLGDGNERTIVEVDLRDGEAVVPGEESEGGYLKLKMLDAVDEDDTARKGIDARLENEAKRNEAPNPDQVRQEGEEETI